MLTAITGALAGCFHVFSGPDHLAAVAPLALEDGRRGWRVGWTWGLGHASGAVLVAVLAVLVREWLPSVETISEWSERLVGAALIALGVWALRRSLRLRSAVHVHGSFAHDHLHVQAGPRWLRRLGHGHASFCMGVLHGLAGSSHFLGVLPALAMPTRGASLLYVAAFGAGTVVAMTAFAACLGVAGTRTDARRTTHRAMLTTTAILAILVGAVWLIAPPAS